jgi:hypothetical protein
MKKVLMLAFLFGSAISVHAQLVLSTGSQLVVNSGSVVVANDVTCSGGTIKNNGDVSVLGDITNNDGALMDATSSGTLTFEGSSAQEITGTASCTFYGTVDINNSNGVAFTNTSTGNHQTIAGTLNFTSGKLTLNGFNLTLGATDPTGADASKYVVTNGVGLLKRVVGASDVVFPIGNSSYNPVTLNNTGTSDTYSVRVVDAEPAASSSDHMVDRSWVIGEDNLGGSNLTITPQWNTIEVLTGFDPDNCSVGLTTNSGQDYVWSETVAASGSNPYYIAGESFTSVGSFAVGDYYYAGKRINLTFFLAGAYNSGSMTKTLNTKGLIPISDPYSVGVSVASVPTDAVDWVVVRLRDKNNSSSIVSELAFFVNQTGQLLDIDGSIGGKVRGVSLDDYFIEVNHRNHNGVMTLNALDLTQETPSFNFTTNTDIYGTDSQADLGSGVYGLRKGNVNNDGRISKTGPPTINDYTALLNVLGANTYSLNIYSGGDINMDGDVRKVGPLTINDYSALLNSLGVSTSITQQLP